LRQIKRILNPTIVLMKQDQNSASGQSIPQYALYGEDPWLDDPGFIHCEDIASRSSALGWKIDPHRHGQLYQCLLVENGRTLAVLDDRQFEATKSCVLWIPPGVVHSFQFAPQTQGCVISFAERILLDAENALLRDFIGELLTAPLSMILARQSNHFKHVSIICDLLQEELQASEPGKLLSCEALLNQLLIQLRRIQLEAGIVNQSGDHNSLFQAFKRELDRHFKEHWDIGDYADALSITPSRLTRLIRKTTGVGAKEIIQRRLLMESKRKLLYTRQTADEIAFDLGFKDPAYFSRFFKKFTELSPGKFREVNRF